MYWIALIIETDAVHAEALSNALIELGALSVDIHEANIGKQNDQILFEQFNDLQKISWAKVEITSLFDESIKVASIVRTAVDIAQMPSLPVYRIKKLEDQNWVRLTQSQFGPIKISSRLWIVPSWSKVSDPAAINIRLDPGLAFGTGSHPTTQLCLNWLEENLQGGEQILDYGCGTGILTIAALKFGAGHAFGVDIDPQAIKSSIYNAVQNKCDQKKIKFYLADQISDTGQEINKWADVVIANILANPLIMLAPILMLATRDNGRIVLSGILKEQVKDVEQAYRQWFRMCLAKEQGDWALLTGTRK